MTTYNRFESVPVLDPARPGLHLPSRLSVTLRFFGTPEARAGLIDTMAGRLGTKSTPALCWLGRRRAETAAGPLDPNRTLFHIALPTGEDSMVAFATNLANEIKTFWPGVTLVANGTPHQRYRSHQVLVVDGGRHCYTEQPADANDTFVIVAGSDGVIGLMRDGLWLDAEDRCSNEDVVDAMHDHIAAQPDGAGGGVGFLAWLDDGHPAEWMFNDANLELERWGRRLFVVRSTL